MCIRDRSNEGPTRGPDQRVDVVRVCDPGAYVSLLDVQRCDVTLLVTAPASDDATALDACCESIGLLDQALCLCDPNIASLIAQTRFASTPMLNSVYGSCGFRISTLDSNGMCVRVGSPMFGPPPVRGRPPRPSRPPSPSPPVPGAPSGPSGPPGPPGRTVVLAGAGRVPGSAKDPPLYFVSKCPPWVRRCGYRDWKDWEEDDAVFPTNPTRLPPSLMMDYEEYFDG